MMDDKKDLEQESVQPEEQALGPITQGENYKEKFLSLMADFQNFKKRSAAQEAMWTTFAKEQIILEFLPINDEFERVLANKPQVQSPDAAIWLTAVETLSKLFQSILNKHNIKEIPCNGIFDPESHEVISEIDHAEAQKGQIVAVFKKGYTYNQKMIRNAQVVVAKGHGE